MDVLYFFDYYTNEYGWRIIPIRPFSKRPYKKSWNRWHGSAENRSFIETQKKCNLGLLLGKVVDVEADTVEANNKLNRLIADYPHPMYRSEKSIHHLFASDNELLTRVVIGGIEFRGRNHQSLLPPSINQNNTAYSWLSESRFPLPPLPNVLKSLLGQRVKKRTRDLTNIRCAKCEEYRRINKKRLCLEIKAFGLMGERWQCRLCRKVDLRQVCRQIKVSCRSEEQRPYFFSAQPKFAA